MRKVELVNGIESSALAFGCAPIMGAIGKTKAKFAVDFAIDHGINHFDLARSYGYGEAERFVGNLLKGKRHQMVLASKFGIVANWKARLLRPAIPFLRIIKDNKRINIENNKDSISGLKNLPGHFHDHISLNGKTMRKSLEKSLIALNTDYLDYFLIHEPQHSIGCIDELTETAALLKKEGKIRAWGLAYMRSQKELHATYLDRFDVLQFNNSPGMPSYEEEVGIRGKMPNILFSPLSGGYNDLNPHEKLTKLSRDFPQSVILCSMFNQKHISENIMSIV